MRSFLMTAGLIAGLGLGQAYALEFGTAGEAQAMLENAIVAMKADPAAALDGCTSCARPEGCAAGFEQFRDRDLYVFCNSTGPEAVVIAHGVAPDQLIGKPTAGFVDKAGYAFGQAILDTAKAGEVNSVEYMWPRPGEADASQKIAYLTLIDDKICAVGFYVQ